MPAVSQSRPLRVGIDARMLSTCPTGVGNYIAGLLYDLCQEHPEDRFYLYSNGQVDFKSRANIAIREGGAKIGPIWLNHDVPRALVADEIDVFWGANGVAPIVTLRPTVVTVHDLVYRFAGSTMERRARWTKRLLQGWSVRRAKCVIAVSSATAVDVETVYGRRVDAVIRPNAHDDFYRRDDDVVRNVLEQNGLSKPYWLFAGTLEPRKNLVNLLEAYFSLSTAGGGPPTLALAGASGWGGPRLNRLIEAGERRGCVRRLGYVSREDLASIYCGCEVLWMPSLYEGFGMPLLEAQHCGSPVIHGTHASMVEAAGGLGVATPIDKASIADTMRSVAQGEVPLVCRVFEHEEREREALAGAAALWQCLSQAARASC